MSFIRPEARAAIWRWRELLVGFGVLLCGFWWIWGGAELVQLIGAALALGGAVLMVAGFQRGRFRAESGGPGIVRVDEGQIAYFGPLTGGTVALSEITALSFDPSGLPGHWVLRQPGQPDLHIPANAEGAEALFDAFTSLPGVAPEALLRAQRHQGRDRLVIWSRESQLSLKA